MRLMASAVALGLAAVPGAAQEFKLVAAESEFAEDVDFSALRVYRWKDSQDPGDDPAAHATMVFMIDRALQDEGLRKAQSADEAQLLVRYYTKVERHMRSQPSQERDPVANVRTSFDFANVADGTLVIELYLADGEQRVWRGWTTEATAKKRFSDEQMRSAVERIMARYPPEKEPAGSP